LIAIKEFGLDPATGKIFNTACENTKPEHSRANTAEIAILFVFFTVIPPQEDC
jgi:hypothetical protein